MDWAKNMGYPLAWLMTWVLVSSGASAAPAAGERLHATVFLGWTQGQEQAQLAELVAESGLVRGVSTAIDLDTGKSAGWRPVPPAEAAALASRFLESPGGPQVASWPIPNGGGTFHLERADDEIRLSLSPTGIADRFEVRVVQVGEECQPAEGSWSPSGRGLALSFRFRGNEGSTTIRQGSVELVNVPEALAVALQQAGLQAHARREYAEAARRFRRALELDVRSGDAAYNLACALARSGDRAAALDALRQAVGVDGSRYRRLARRDPDFAPLRELGDFQAIVFADAKGGSW